MREKTREKLIRQKLIIPGQADVLNPVQEHIRITHLRKLPARTIIVLIFDTDTDNPDILRDNLQFLSGKTNAKRIITIPIKQFVKYFLQKVHGIITKKGLLHFFLSATAPSSKIISIVTDHSNIIIALVLFFLLIRNGIRYNALHFLCCNIFIPYN